MDAVHLSFRVMLVHGLQSQLASSCERSADVAYQRLMNWHAIIYTVHGLAPLQLHCHQEGCRGCMTETCAYSTKLAEGHSPLAGILTGRRALKEYTQGAASTAMSSRAIPAVAHASAVLSKVRKVN